MPIERITVRMPSKLRKAAESKAADGGKTLADYIRWLLEQDTGTPPEPVKQGVAALSGRKRKALSAKALVARWGAEKKS